MKSFTDDLAWTVQRQLVKGYFRAVANADREQVETGPSAWLYEGTPENLDLKIPRLSSVEGGYVFLLELSTGGVMVCASNEPGVNAYNIGRRLEEFEVSIAQVAVTRPHPQYLLLKTRIKQALSDLPLVGQTYKGVAIPTIQARAGQVLLNTFRGCGKTCRDMSAKEAKLDGMLDEASRLLEMLRDAVEGSVTVQPSPFHLSGPGYRQSLAAPDQR